MTQSAEAAASAFPLSVRSLIDAGVHFGHQTKRWNPKMRPFIYGARNGVHIVDLDQTARHFKRAYDFLVETVGKGGHVLFVGTKRQAQEIVIEEAVRSQMFFVTNRWLGGTLTNFRTVKGGLDRLRSLERMKEDGTYDQLPKKEVSQLEKERERFEKYVGGLKNMGALPHAMFVIDPHQEVIAVSEAKKLGIPVVAITDTNCDPDLVDYIIPGNDDAIRSIKLITSRVADACVEGLSRRKDVGRDAGGDAGGGSRGPKVEVERATRGRGGRRPSNDEAPPQSLFVQLHREESRRRVMADITASMVKELRERTQAGMSDCKAALVEAEGDMEKAVDVILKKGLAKSAKRAGAAATEGEVRAAIAANGKYAVVVEVNSQTDFVARNDDFQKFVGNVVEVAMSTPAGEDLGARPYPGSDKTLEATRQAVAGTIGENIQVRRWARFDLDGAGLLASYVHMGGKIGVLLEVGTETPDLAAHPAVKAFADDVAMQIAAMSPQWVEKSNVPADAVAKQAEIFAAQLKDEGKPEAAWPKIIEGKKAKWFTEVCLLDQESCVTPGSSIDKLRAEVAKTAGGMVTIRRFARFERGEGIEKKSDDFASEVAKMAGG